MTERYQFEYRGASFTADVDVDLVPTTTDAPNIRVVAGSWPTWRVEFYRPEGAPPEARQYRCVAESVPSSPHPHGNLTAAESASDADVLMIRDDGYLARASVGESLLWPWRDEAYRTAFHERLNAPLDRQAARSRTVEDGS